MALKKSNGNMYPWVTHMHAHLRGACPHACSYCYAQAHERRWGSGAFSGDIRVREEEFSVNYGADKTIFIEHQNDLFAEGVDAKIILRVLHHCREFCGNKYVFQTKNPQRMLEFLSYMPTNRLVGTTIESDIHFPDVMNKSPEPWQRFNAMLRILCEQEKFVTIEPIIKFNHSTLVGWMKMLRPTFVNIGADSKGSGLPEPTRDDVLALIDALTTLGIEVRGKHNLERLVGK